VLVLGCDNPPEAALSSHPATAPSGPTTMNALAAQVEATTPEPESPRLRLTPTVYGEVVTVELVSREWGTAVRLEDREILRGSGRAIVPGLAPWPVVRRPQPLAAELARGRENVIGVRLVAVFRKEPEFFFGINGFWVGEPDVVLAPGKPSQMRFGTHLINQYGPDVSHVYVEVVDQKGLMMASEPISLPPRLSKD
jgi:hypothetical protein